MASHRQLLDFFRRVDGYKVDWRFPCLVRKRLLKDMVVAFGGMRFTSVDLRDVRGMGIVLEACACTLEALRIYPDDTPFPCKRVH